MTRPDLQTVLGGDDPCSEVMASALTVRDRVKDGDLELSAEDREWIESFIRVLADIHAAAEFQATDKLSQTNGGLYDHAK